MKNLTKKVAIGLIITLFVFNFFGFNSAFATTTLGTTNTYGVLSSTFTSNGGLTTITGDAGYTTLSGSGTTSISGTTTTPKPAQAGIDQGTALSSLDLAPCTFSITGVFHLGSDATHGPVGVYTPGVYCSTGAMDIDGGATITLNGNGTYIFRSGGALNTTSNSKVLLAGGASECNVFWTPAGATTLGANSTFIGTDIDDAGITIGSTVSWLGRALAFATTITTDTDTITVPTSCGTIPTPPLAPKLTLVKIINGGSSVLADFPLTATGPNTITGVSGTSAVTNAAALAGAYTLTEQTQSNYTAGSWSCTGGTLVGNVITLNNGDDVACTIANTYITPVVSTPAKNSGGGGGGYLYGCKDPSALNYNAFSISTPSLCKYTTLLTTPTASTISTTTTTTTTTTPSLPKTGFPPKEENILGNIINIIFSFLKI